MAMTTGDIPVRGQNIGLLEAGRGRKQQSILEEQQRALQERMNRENLAQRAAEFKTEMDWRREEQRRREEEAEAARWMQLAGSLGGGLLSGGLGILGRAVYPKTPSGGHDG